MGFLTTKSSIYLTIITLIGVTAPFWHVFYGIRDTEGLFGYRFMSSFLNSLGTRLSILCMGLLILFFSKHIVNEYKKAAKTIGLMTLYVGCYFLILIAIPKKILLNSFGIKDFHPFFYYLSMTILSISSGFVFTLLQKAFIITEANLKFIIRELFDFLNFQVRKKGMIRDEYKEEFDNGVVELVKTALDNE